MSRPAGIAGVGLAAALLGYVDPLLGLPPWAGVPAGLAAWVLARREGAARPVRRFAALATVLALAFAAGAHVRPDLGADSRSYLLYLRSVVFDGDLDFANDLALWGYGEVPPGEWLRVNTHPVGPAILWAPAYLAAHAWVRAGHALGREEWTANGIDVPYVRATAAVTIAAVVLALVVLAGLLRRRYEPAVARLAVAGTWLGSTIPFYTLAQPHMAHAWVFALAACALAALERAVVARAAASWYACAGFTGLVALCRWQAAVFALVPAAVAVAEWRRGRLAPRTAATAAALGLLVFVPQLAAWKVQWGRFLTMPQGAGYVDWTSPRLFDVLLSADRGLLPWTPVAALGLLLVPLCARRWGLAPTAAAVVVAGVTAWVNGGVQDFHGGDAYGARRFDLVIPFAAFGLAEGLARAVPWLRAHPLASPAAALLVLALWNAGLMRLYRHRVFTRAAPLDRVAAAQAGQVEDGLLSLAARVSPRASRLAHAVLVGEFVYESVPGGDLQLATLAPRFLGEGWSPPRAREGWPAYRWAHHPEACFSLPLAEPLDLPVKVLVRTPRRLDGQSMALAVNGTAGAAAPVPAEWTEITLVAPRSALRRGPNRVCLRFSRSLAGEEREVAAAVARAEIP